MKTFVKTRQPWGIFARNGHRAICSDGIIRAVELAQTADTFFSIPARVRIKGKSISGYVTTDNLENGNVYSFRHYNGNEAYFPEWPASFTPEYEALMSKAV